MSISKNLSSIWSTKESLRGAFEQVLLFGIQWEDLEDRFDSTAKSLDERFECLKAQERSAEERLRAVESKEKEVVALTQKKAEEFDAAILGKQGELDLLERRIEECETELKKKGNELVSARASVEQCNGMIRMKQQQLDELQKTIETKNQEYAAIHNSIKNHSVDLEEKRKQLKPLQTLVIEWGEKIKLHEGRHSSVQESVTECSEKLESKKQQLDAMNRSLDKCSDELALGRSELEIREGRDECNKDIEAKMEEYRVLQASTERRSEMLAAKEKQLDEQLAVLKSQQEQMLQQEKQLESRERPITAGGQVKADRQSDSCFPLRDAIDLLLFICESLERPDLVREKVSDAVRSSPDPAKLVLEALQRFEQLTSTTPKWKFDIGITKRSCLALLGLLSEVSTIRITLQVKEMAMKLASRWKAELAYNHLEVLAFLKLLVVFGLGSGFPRKLLVNIINFLPNNEQADELRDALRLPREIIPCLPPPIPLFQVPRQGMKRPNLSSTRIDNYLQIGPPHDVYKRRCP